MPYIKYLFSILLSLLFCFAAHGQTILDPDLKLDKIVIIPQNQERPVRLDKLPNGNLVYGTLNGEIYEIIDNKPTLFADQSNHSLSYLSSLDVYENDMYICGSIIQPGDTTMIGYVWKGDIGNNTWRLLAYSDPYYLGLGFNDHRFSSLIVSEDGSNVFVHSGTRTNAGEVHHLPNVNGTIGLRDQPLRGKLFKLPTDLEEPIFLSVDSAELYQSGFIYCEGLRHCFALGWGTDGSLYGASNSDRRDVGEAFYKIEENRHYGFPWWIGGEINPLQSPDYDVKMDKLAGSSINNQGYYNPDPNFPPMPTDIDFVQPYKNIGPDADKIRDKTTGDILDASDLGLTMTTFSGHRSPTGLKFDVDNSLPEPYNGDGFMVSFGGGLGGDRKDLLHLTLLDDERLSAATMINGFNSLLDVFIDDQSLYLLESGSSNGSGRAIYKVSFSETTANVEYGGRDLKIQINPNPTTGILQYKLDNPNLIRRIDLVNLLGQKQRIGVDLENKSINLSGISPGTYFLLFQLPSGHHLIERIVKI